MAWSKACRRCVLPLGSCNKCIDEQKIVKEVTRPNGHDIFQSIVDELHPVDVLALGKKDEPFDNVDRVLHYQVIPEKEVEAIDIISALLGCEEAREITPYQAACYKDVLKYGLRCLKKGSFLEDLKKAQTYIRFIVEDIEGVKEDGKQEDRPSSGRPIWAIYREEGRDYTPTFCGSSKDTIPVI